MLFQKFTGNHLCQIIFFNKVASLYAPWKHKKTGGFLIFSEDVKTCLKFYLKKDLWHRWFPVNFLKLLEYLIYGTPPDDCFFMYRSDRIPLCYYFLLRLLLRKYLSRRTTVYTSAWNTVISPNYLMWTFWRNTQHLLSFRRSENCAFPQKIQTKQKHMVLEIQFHSVKCAASRIRKDFEQLFIPT